MDSKIISARKLDEATEVEFARLGKYVSAMSQPGSGVSEELFNLVDKQGGVHEKSLVQFFRTRGGLSTISEEDIEEIEDLIEKAWKIGRRARGYKDTGADKNVSFAQ